MQHFPLNNEMVFVLVEAAGGIYNSEHITTICQVANADSAFLKVTEDNRIGFMIKPENIEKAKQTLAKSGLLLRGYRSAGVISPKACLGELCPQKEQDALTDAIDLGQSLQKSFGEKPFVSIGVNGCSQTCLGSSLDDIHLVGESSGYKIAIGGKSSEMPQNVQFLAENIEKEKLAPVVEAVLKVYFENQQEGERLYDVVERIGITPFNEAIAGFFETDLSGFAADETSAEVESDALTLADDATMAGDVTMTDNAMLADDATAIDSVTDDVTFGDTLELGDALDEGGALTLDEPAVLDAESDELSFASTGDETAAIGLEEPSLGSGDEFSLDDEVATAPVTAVAKSDDTLALDSQDDVLALDSQTDALGLDSVDDVATLESPAASDLTLDDTSLDLSFDDGSASLETAAVSDASEEFSLDEMSTDAAVATSVTDDFNLEDDFNATTNTATAASDDVLALSLDDTPEFSDASSELELNIDTDAETPAAAAALTETAVIAEPAFEDEFDISEATGDDVDSMTRTIRSEAELESKTAVEALDSAPLDIATPVLSDGFEDEDAFAEEEFSLQEDLVAPASMPAPVPNIANLAEHKREKLSPKPTKNITSGAKIRVVNGMVECELGDIKFKMSLEKLIEGKTVHLEINDHLIALCRKGHDIELSVDELCLSVGADAA